MNKVLSSMFFGPGRPTAGRSWEPAPTGIETSRAPSSIPCSRDFVAPRRWSVWDYAGVVTGVLLTFAITVVNSRGRIFWEDEMLGWLLLHDASWHHMVRAWNLGADGGGFSFYLLGRAWFRLFGDSRLAFRMFSSACFGLAFVALWAALRRVYPTWIVAFAAFNSIFFSPPLTTHFIEGRFYGLLTVSTALALWLAVALDATPEPTPKRFYVAAFLVHGLLTTSHVLGVVYSFFLLCATLTLDRMRRRQRIGLYLSIAASWLLLLPEWTSIFAAARVGKPHFWTHAPTALDVLGAYTGFSREILIVLALLVSGAAFSVLRRPGALRDSLQQRRAAYIVAGCLLLVPVWFLLEGIVGTWLFSDRYLQPVVLGVAVATAELLRLASDHPLLTELKRRWPLPSVMVFVVSTACFSLVLLVWVFHHVAEITPEPPDFTQQLTDHMPRDLPVVLEDAFTFTELMGTQAHSGVRYTFLLDWPYSLSPDAPRLEVTQFHLMENWKLAGYFADHIENRDDFLRAHTRFLAVHNGTMNPPAAGAKPEIGNPLADRLGHTAGYEVQPFFTLDRAYKDGARDTVWLVCRGGCSGPTPGRPAHCVMVSITRTSCDSNPDTGMSPGLRTRQTNGELPALAP